MEPVSNRVVRILFTRDIQILVQLLELALNTSTTGLIIGSLSQKIPILEVNSLGSVILLDLVKNVLPDFLRAVENRLNASSIPIKKLFLKHVLNVIHQCGVKLLNNVLFGDLVEGRIDVQPTEHIIPDYGAGGSIRILIIASHK